MSVANEGTRMSIDRESRRIAAPTSPEVLRILRFLALIAIGFASPSGATPQRPDHLQYLGTSHEVHGFDISREMAESFFRYKQRLKESGMILENSSNSDGFDAELSIVEGKLFLMSIRIDHSATTEEVFGVSMLAFMRTRGPGLPGHPLTRGRSPGGLVFRASDRVLRRSH